MVRLEGSLLLLTAKAHDYKFSLVSVNLIIHVTYLPVVAIHGACNRPCVSCISQIYHECSYGRRNIDASTPVVSVSVMAFGYVLMKGKFVVNLSMRGP